MIDLNQEMTLEWYVGEIAGHTPGALSALVPPSYAAFARVLNPVRTPEGRRLRWSDLVGRSMTLDSATQWSDIVSAVHPDPNRYYEPESGTLDREVALRLSTILLEHTKSRDFMFFVWEGYSSLLDEVLATPTIVIGQQRVMHVRRGGPESALEPIDSPPNRLAMNWLPNDGAWFVGNEIYARSVFVAGTAAAVGAVLTEPALETYQVRPGSLMVPED